MRRPGRFPAVALILLAATAMSRSLLATPWIETALLVHARGAADDHFATSVAIDGDVAVVGDPDGNSEVGAAHVFLRS